MQTQRLLLESLSFIYWAVRRLFELLVLVGRSDREKEIEIRVPRTQKASRGGCFDLPAAVLCR